MTKAGVDSRSQRQKGRCKLKRWPAAGENHYNRSYADCADSLNGTCIIAVKIYDIAFRDDNFMECNPFKKVGSLILKTFKIL